MASQAPPLVSLSHFSDGDAVSTVRSRERDSAAAALLKAASHFGYAHVAEHGVPEDVSSRLFAESRHFFHGCATTGDEQVAPQLLLSSSTYRGYQKLGDNVTQAMRDAHRALDFHRTLPDGYELPASASPELKQLAFGNNIYPSAEFGEAVDEYMKAMLHAGSSVMRAVCHALRTSPAMLADCFSNPFWVLRVISYPSSCPNTADNAACSELSLGCGPHRDYGWLTFVITDERPDSVGALEISKDGSDDGFEPAALPPPGSFLLNFGDCLEALTNGLFPATLHRVAQPRTDRLAIAAFIGTDFLEFHFVSHCYRNERDALLFPAFTNIR